MKRISFAAALAVILSNPAAAADDEPRLYKLDEVGESGAVTVHSSPSPSAPIIGTLEQGATVEVTSRTATRRWGRINLAEQAGWVFLRNFEQQERLLDDLGLPVGLRCYGTEPFWSLTAQDGAMRLSQPDSDDLSLTIEVAQGTGIPDDLRRMIRLSGESGQGVAYVAQGQCSDGMSDRLFALTAAVMVGDNTPLLTGCCTLLPQN